MITSITTAYQREQIEAILAQLDAVLPAQAPILNFVHHNTLHGFQHLPFDKALAEFKAITGIDAYVPEQKYRLFYQQGRITDDDISSVLAEHPDLATDPIVCQLGKRKITKKELYQLALAFDFKALSMSELKWHNDELDALNTVQADVPASACAQLFKDAPDKNTVIQQLWNRILDLMELQEATLHPEDLLDLSLEQAEEWLANYQSFNPTQEQRLGEESKDAKALDNLFLQIGSPLTLRDLVLKLSGIDILDSVRPQLIRVCASALDEGVAAWQNPENKHLGLYSTWRSALKYDANPFLHELPNWQQALAELPESAIDAIALHLTQLEIPQQNWALYLERLALEIPGWAGMINWREHHPNYTTHEIATPRLSDFLAIRLTLDRLWLNHACMELWNTPATLSALHAYFRKNLAEFTVRLYLFKGTLPEYLTQLAETLTIKADPERQSRAAWQQLTELIWTWQCYRIAGQNDGHRAHNSGWRLFRLCQHLGLTHAQVNSLKKADLLAMLETLNSFDETARSKTWLTAYEINYRDRLLSTLSANHLRGRWATRNHRPEAQLIFCMDDREEGFRRHLEEHNPALETLGAAGFFGVAMNYQGLDDQNLTPLCPVVVTPAHNIYETALNQKQLHRHQQAKKGKQFLANVLHHSLRRNLLISNPLINLMAPITLLSLIAKSLLPSLQQKLLKTLDNGLAPSVATQLNINATNTISTATTEHPQHGFTDQEQATRVAGFLKTIGLTEQFSSLVVLMGHGSISQNNPHLAAYDCGACSGRHGGPNARAFAAMANRPEIRQLLTEQGIYIPNDTWFIGAEHNTCNEEISWYDLSNLPSTQSNNLKTLQLALTHAQHLSAHERCRRLVSAPRNPTPQEALAHIQERAVDFSQARPELGHATNAAALVGRRSLTQGAFFDRRLFLISYDPTQDIEGKILENILLAVGPVGSGINLEYYFSTVNNDRFGCGSKVPHNVTGFFGVMEGTSSDLRTGLPQQMVEIHEAMRLQLIVEAKTTVLERIYTEQASLRELIGGGWLHLTAKDPDSAELFIFKPDTGFTPWRAKTTEIPMADNSPACYQDHTLPVAPMLIKQPELQGA